MRKVWILAAALLFAVALQADELTVEQILTKNLEAKGGAEKIKALNSVRFTGKMAMGGMEAPLTMVKKRPENMRLEFTIQGMTGTQAYDGTTGWMVMPFMGKKDPEAVAGEPLKEMKEQSDFDGPFIDSEKKGYKIESLGKVDVEGTPAYKLKLTREGNETVMYLDADSFLEIKAEAKRKIQGQEIEAETSFGNYQEFDGLLFPMSIEMKAKGQPAGQSITIEKVEINPTLADDLFKMPVKKEATEAAKQP